MRYPPENRDGPSSTYIISYISIRHRGDGYVEFIVCSGSSNLLHRYCAAAVIYIINNNVFRCTVWRFVRYYNEYYIKYTLLQVVMINILKEKFTKQYKKRSNHTACDVYDKSIITIFCATAIVQIILTGPYYYYDCLL